MPDHFPSIYLPPVEEFVPPTPPSLAIDFDDDEMPQPMALLSPSSLATHLHSSHGNTSVWGRESEREKDHDRPSPTKSMQQHPNQNPSPTANQRGSSTTSKEGGGYTSSVSLPQSLVSNGSYHQHRPPVASPTHGTGMKVEYVAPNVKSIHFVPHLFKRITVHTTPANMEKLNASDSLLGVVKDLQDILNLQEDLTKDARNKQLLTSMEKIKDSYLLLFERGMDTVLKLDKQKEEQRVEKERQYTSTIESMEAQINHLSERNKALLNACEAKDCVNRMSTIRIDSLEAENADLYATLRPFQNEARAAQLSKDRAEQEAATAKKESLKLKLEAEQRKKELESFISEGVVKSPEDIEHDGYMQKLRRRSVSTDYNQFHAAMATAAKYKGMGGGSGVDMEALRRQIESEVRATMKPPEPVIIYRDKEPKKKEKEEAPRSSKKTSGVDSCTQTEVNDEDGLWDVHDAISNKVARGPVAARLRWMDAYNYARCNNCHKRVGKARKPVKELKAIVLKNGHKVKRQKHEGEWLMSDYFKDWLSNLPPSVVAAKVKPLPWLMDQIDHLYMEKLNADAQDQQDGSSNSEFNVFTTELYLLESGMRRLAELRVYELLMATKEHLKTGGQCVRIFARMLGCLYSNEEGDKNSYIPSNIGSAVLYFRKRLFSLPDQWHKPIVINHGVRVWLPIEPAVSLLKIALFYLPPRKLELQCRKIEENAAILSNGGKIVPQSEIVGARMDVRAAMRRAMIDSENAEQDAVVKESNSRRPRKAVKSGGDGNENTNSNTKGNETLIVVDVNEVLDIIIESLFGRKLSIADELKRLFVRGDENGDGVLSFNEFSQILKDLPRDKTDEQLSSRQALHIYRNALSYCGEGLDISKTTFVHICEKFNLIPLCDINKVELLEADLESKKISATADGDATKLTTVIAAKESAAKGALLDLMRGIEAVKIAVERAPAHIRSKLSRLIRHLSQTSTVCSADIPKVIPSFDASSIRTEAESYLTLQKAMSVFTPKGSSVPGGGGRRQTINAITPASPTSGDSLRKHLLMKNSAKSMAISSSEGYSESSGQPTGEGTIALASVHPPLDDSHAQKVPKKLESRKSLFFGDDETFKG